MFPRQKINKLAISKILNDLLIEVGDYNLIKPDELRLDFLDEKQDIFKDVGLDLGSAFLGLIWN
jgi:hypothetical protein